MSGQRWGPNTIGQLLDATGLLFDLLFEAEHGDGGPPDTEKLLDARDKILAIAAAIHGEEAA